MLAGAALAALALPASASRADGILSVVLSPTVVHGGTTVHADVRTSPAIRRVEASVGPYAIAVPRVGNGHFAGSTTVPWLPPWIHGTYVVVFTGWNDRGGVARSGMPVRVP